MLWAFVCLPSCARFLCIMKGEEKRKEHNYCSLAIYGISVAFLLPDQSAVFVFWWAHFFPLLFSWLIFAIIFLFAYMSMAGETTMNNRKRGKKTNEISQRLWSRLGVEDVNNQKAANGKSPSEFNLINSFIHSFSGKEDFSETKDARLASYCVCFCVCFYPKYSITRGCLGFTSSLWAFLRAVA